MLHQFPLCIPLDKEYCYGVLPLPVHNSRFAFSRLANAWNMLVQCLTVHILANTYHQFYYPDNLSFENDILCQWTGKHPDHFHNIYPVVYTSFLHHRHDLQSFYSILYTPQLHFSHYSEYSFSDFFLRAHIPEFHFY